MAFFITDECICCNHCARECPVAAISRTDSDIKFLIDQEKCIGCGHCAELCNLGAVFDDRNPAPVPVPHEMEELWCDLVVIGGGGSGLTAAARAASISDAKVIVLEKTLKTGGGAWFAADYKIYGSKWQKERNLPDVSAQDFLKAMDLTYWKLDAALVKDCFSATGQFFDWICEIGDNIEDQVEEGHYVHDNNSGPVIPVYKHSVHCFGGMGKLMVKTLQDQCRRKNVDILTECRALDVEVSDGRISAVIAEDSGGPIKIHCKACILSSGSWINNQEILEKVIPEYAKLPVRLDAHRNKAYTGDGIAIAEKVGAYLDYESFTLRLMGPIVPNALFPCESLQSMELQKTPIWVGANGKRWINEQHGAADGFDIVAHAMLHRAGGVSFRVFDTGMLEAAVAETRRPDYTPDTSNPFAVIRFPEDYEGDLKTCAKNMPDYFFIADTLEELAEKIHVPVDTFCNTIKQYNKMCQEGIDADYYRDAETMVPITRGPFYACKGIIETDGAFGGILVNNKMQALNKAHVPIDGFYCTGDFASGRFINSSGIKLQIINDLSWAFASGFIAGNEAAGYLTGV